MLSESERKQMEEGFMQVHRIYKKNSNPSIALALEMSSAVRALNTSVSEMEMSPYRVSLGEVKDKVGSSFRVGWSPCMNVKRD